MAKNNKNLQEAVEQFTGTTVPRDMLEEAFVDNYVVDDGRIELEGDPLPCLNPIILLPYPQFQPGDQVKVIVLKEEEG